MVSTIVLRQKGRELQALHRSQTSTRRTLAVLRTNEEVGEESGLVDFNESILVLVEAAREHTVGVWIDFFLTFLCALCNAKNDAASYVRRRYSSTTPFTL